MLELPQMLAQSFGYEVRLIIVTNKKKLKLCTLISSSLQSKSTVDPEGLLGRPARHKLMQAFQELYKMTHIGLS